AACDAADHDRPRGVAGTGNGAVDPFVAGGVEGLGKFGDRRGFAARCPPMRNLEVGGDRRRRKGQRDRRDESSGQELITHGVLPKSETLQVEDRGDNINAQWFESMTRSIFCEYRNYSGPAMEAAM